MKRVLDYAERSASSGRFPYEGQWLTKNEIAKRIRAKRRAAIVHMLELLLLFGSTYLVAGLAWKFIALLTY